jgi:membrane protein
MQTKPTHAQKGNKLWRLVLRSKPVKRFSAFLQTKQFLGYKGISWYSVLEFFMRWVDKRDLQLRATSLSYTFFLALFPSIIFIFTLIAYTPLSNSHKAILLFFEQLLPTTAYKATEHTLLDILNTQRGGLLSFGFLTAIYFSTNGFVSLMNALNRSDQRKETRSFWKKRIVAIILAIVVSISLLLAVVLLTIGNFSIKYLDKLAYFPSKITPVLLVVLNIGVVAALVLFFVSLIFYLAPALNRRFKFISPGSVFACISILVTTLAFSTYINQFNTYNKVYGSIGALIVVMLLIYINTYILLLGYEFNIAIDKAVSEIKLQRKTTALKTNRLFVAQETDFTD